MNPDNSRKLIFPKYRVSDTFNKPLVIGIGNTFRGDDAVGPLVAHRLKEAALPGITVLEHDGEGTALLALWEGYSTVILVDAAVSGAEPGTIHRWEAGGKGDSVDSPTRAADHGLGVVEAIELARRLGRLPERFVVYGIEAGSFELGAELTTVVAQAAEDVVDRIGREVGGAAGSSTGD